MLIYELKTASQGDVFCMCMCVRPSSPMMSERIGRFYETDSEDRAL
jgi:hypothetical protein